MSNYVAHIPSINTDTHLKRLSVLQLALVALCNEPKSLHFLVSALAQKYSQRQVTRAITKLTYQGYLANCAYHVNGDTFTTINHPGTLQRTYPAIRSERINIPTTSKRLNGEYR